MIHLRLPEVLLRDLDEFRGDRSRTEVIRTALEGYLRMHQLLRTVREGNGLLAKETAEQWGTPEAVDRWIDTVRSGWDKGGG